MAELEQIFGAALSADERNAEASGDSTSVGLPVDVSAVSASGDGESGPEEKETQTEPMSLLASFVMKEFRKNADFRRESGIDDSLLYSMKTNKAEFTDEQLAALKSLGIPEHSAKKLHTSMTTVKTRGAKSIMNDIVSQGGEPLFSIEPSPVPEVPEEVSESAFSRVAGDIQSFFVSLEKAGVTQIGQEQMEWLKNAISYATEMQYDETKSEIDEFARKRAARMQKKVWDIMEEGGWNSAVNECISNFCTYGTCVMRGPVMKAVEKNVCHKGKNGVVKYVRELKMVPTFESINPWDCYPAPNAKSISDGTFCVKIRYSCHDLWRFSESVKPSQNEWNGWNDRAIKKLLDQHPYGGVKLTIENDLDESERREAEGKSTDDTNDCDFEGVLCYSFVRGTVLADIGISKTTDGENVRLFKYYKTESVVIDGLVVYCRVIDDRMDFPISKAVFYDFPDSWWGESIADKLKNAQMMQNNVSKAMFFDLASTGAMFWVRNASLLRDKSATATQYSPYKTIAFDEAIYSPGSTAAPMGVLDVPTKAGQLISEWDLWNNQADNDSGIPRFAEGQTAGQTGALRTSGGLAQIQENMMRGAKMSAKNFDEGIIKVTAKMTADYVLVYDDDMDIKGDVFIRSVGILGRIMKSQREQRRLQVLNMILNSQYMLQLLGPNRVLNIFRPSVQDLDMKAKDAIPSIERVKFMELIEQLKQLAAAEQQQPIQQEQPQGENGGAVPGVAQPPSVQPQGGVAERRSVA